MSGGKFEEKLTCGLEKNIRNFASFQRLKNSKFILEIKMVELNENKNLKQLDWRDVVSNLCFSLEIS